MENLMNNVSLWGITVVVLATFRLTWQARFTTDTNLLAQKVHFFIQSSYKPLTVFILSTAALWVCRSILPATYLPIWISAIAAGALSIGAGLLLRIGVARELLKLETQINGLGKAATTLFDEKTTANAGTLFLGLASVLSVFAMYHQEMNWDVYSLLSCLGSFALGSAAMLLIIKMYKTSVFFENSEAYAALVNHSGEVVSRDRFDALVGTIVAAMLLGTVFGELSDFQNLTFHAGAVVLPLALAFSGVVISTSAAIFCKIKGWENNPAIVMGEKMISALVMIVAAFFLINNMLPITWITGGQEYKAMEVFYAAQVGIIGGMLANKVIQLYRAIHNRYYTYLAGKSFQQSLLDKIFHYALELISFITPLSLIIFAILFSHHTVGIYGILIAMVAMLANLTTKLTTEIAKN